MSELDDFRGDAAAWLMENCPPGARGPGQISSGSSKVPLEPDVQLWLERMAERGWTTPTWPSRYGGGDLTPAQARVLQEEMTRIGARPPLTGMGVGLIGPTLLELGTDDQKQRHLPDIARGEVQWCQGYSEPNAGSDLASLKTRADDRGDHFVINGQKIWTSGAIESDWMFALVRTDFDAPKHQGISFVLLTMDQPGITVKPIRLISGASPFCETFFDNAIARKEDLVGQLNDGWSVGKRLLQHERSRIGGLSGGDGDAVSPAQLVEWAKQFVGERNGRIADPAVRETITNHWMNSDAFRLTALRTNEESRSGTPGAATSIFKLYGAGLQQDAARLRRELMGTRGLGADTAGFTDTELQATSEWLSTHATTIYGGSNEIQANIIAKRVLGLPD